MFWFQQTLSLPRNRGPVSCFFYKYHIKCGGVKKTGKLKKIKQES